MQTLERLVGIANQNGFSEFEFEQLWPQLLAAQGRVNQSHEI